MRVRLFGALLLTCSCSFAACAQDAAALYRSQCLVCHGENGAGKTAIKGTNLLADLVKKASDADLTEAITQGGKKKTATHAFEKKGLKPDQVQALVKYVRELQSKPKS